MNDDTLLNKARRAAEWLKSGRYIVNHFPAQGPLKEHWMVRRSGMDVATPPRYYPQDLIKYAQENGWVDTEDMTIDQAEEQGLLHPVYAADARSLGYHSYDFYLDEECK